MQRFINHYLNEIVSLAVMCLMIVALIHTESQATHSNRSVQQDATTVSIVVEASQG